MSLVSKTELHALLWLSQELESKTLKLLKEAKGNILDDEVLINTLNNSKLTAGMIQNRVREAEQTENSIDQVSPTDLQAADAVISPLFVAHLPSYLFLNSLCMLSHLLLTHNQNSWQCRHYQQHTHQS